MESLHTFFVVTFMLIFVSKCNTESIFRFANIFGSHMVLQKSPSRARIWGHGEIGQDVLLSHGHELYRASVLRGGDNQGTWSVLLTPQLAGGPHTITVHSKVNGSQVAIIIDDILFGDVWFCSGQSNMEFTVIQSDDGAAAINESLNYPNIRVFTASEAYSQHPLRELEKVELPWSRPSPDSIGGDPWTYFSAVCWYYGVQLYNYHQYPIGLIASTWGGTPIEAWSSPVALKECNITSDKTEVYGDTSFITLNSLDGFMPQNYSVLWNAMVHPFLNMSIYGVIWYQGEQNAEKYTHTYNCTFPAMIDDWRSQWSLSTKNNTNYNFPFGFVQLSATGDNLFSQSSNFAPLRWNQTAQYGYVPNPRQQRVFMAVAMDLGNPNSIYVGHPTDKKDVGYRLALAGLAVAYNVDIYYSGPLVSKITQFSSGKLMIEFTSYEDRIEVISNKGFEVLCNGEWTPAQIVDFSRTSVLIAPDSTCDVVETIRYAWSDYPCVKKQCAIYSNNIPSPPFIKHAPFA